MGKLALKSPKATVIVDVLVEPGVTVGAGQALLELPTWEEDKILSEIARQIKETGVKLLEVTPGPGSFASSKLSTLVQLAIGKRKGVVAARKCFEAMRVGLEVGTRTILDVCEAQSNFNYASLTALQTAIEGEIFERNMADAVKVYTAVLELLHREKGYVERCRDRCTIRAPRSGVFSCFVRKGTPVRLGHLLGTVE